MAFGVGVPTKKQEERERRFFQFMLMMLILIAIFGVIMIYTIGSIWLDYGFGG